MKNVLEKIKAFFVRLFKRPALATSTGEVTEEVPPAEEIIERADSDNGFFRWFTFVMAVIAVGVTIAMGVFLIVEPAASARRAACSICSVCSGIFSKNRANASSARSRA